MFEKINIIFQLRQQPTQTLLKAAKTHQRNPAVCLAHFQLISNRQPKQKSIYSPLHNSKHHTCFGENESENRNYNPKKLKTLTMN